MKIILIMKIIIKIKKLIAEQHDDDGREVEVEEQDNE